MSHDRLQPGRPDVTQKPDFGELGKPRSERLKIIGRPRELLPVQGRPVIGATFSDGEREFNVQIGYRIYGEGERTVVFNHGTPGSLTDERAKHPPKGVQVVAYDRGGYGDSTSFNRIVADEATMLEAILIAKDIKGPVSTVGFSGGGPRALAQLALLPQVVNGAVISGLAPPEAKKGTKGMTKENAGAFGAKTKEEYEDLWRVFTQDSMSIKTDEDVILRDIILKSGPRDRELLSDETAQRQIAYVHAAGLKNGPAGRFWDVFSSNSPWGFDVRNIYKPLFFYFGDEDVFTPREHAMWYLTNVPAGEINNRGESTGLAHAGHLRDIPFIEKIYRRLQISAENAEKIKVEPGFMSDRHILSDNVFLDGRNSERYHISTVRNHTDFPDGSPKYETLAFRRQWERRRDPFTGRSYDELLEDSDQEQFGYANLASLEEAGQYHELSLQIARCLLNAEADFTRLFATTLL